MIEILPEGVIELIDEFGIAESKEPFVVEVDDGSLDSKQNTVVIWKREKSPTGS